MIETSNAYARGLLAGVKDYIRTHGPLNVHVAEHGRGDRPPKWITEWDGDGILARIENKQIARTLAELRVPVVDLSSHKFLPNVPVVTTDNAMIARLAFQHFTERGFRNFAYCGVKRFAWSLARGGHFDELVSKAGFACDHYEAAEDFDLDSDAETDAIAKWLCGLPKPVAIFAGYDARGLQVLEACKRMGFAVPEQVAVLGVDNDDLLCELSTPALSSVRLNARQTGYLAIELLVRLISGQRVPAEVHRVPAVDVCARQSTDFTAVEDTHVARAGQYIRGHAGEGIEIESVVKAAGLGRRTLEKRFRSLVGRTLQEEIRRVQTHRVKELLINTELPLKDIADRAGFRHVEYLTVAFKRETGQAPSVYRQIHQASPRNGIGHP